MMIERNPPGLPSVVVFVDFPYGFSPISAVVFVDFPYGFSPISAISPNRNPPERPSVTVFMDFPCVFSPFLPFRPTEIHLNSPL